MESEREGLVELLVEFDLNKSIEENAARYFELSKEARKKILGIGKAIDIQKQRDAQRERKDAESAKLAEKKTAPAKKKWFQHYRWFFTSDGLLVIGGKDAHSNEDVVKKRMGKNDVYFHADVFGAPHCFIQAPERLKGKIFAPPEQSLKEAAQFAVTFSKAWEEGRAQADAYSVKPEQVSKRAQSGEHLGTGAFMIYGERNWFRKSALSCAIGFHPREKALMCAPLSAVKKHCQFFFELAQGSLNKNDAAKKLKEVFDKKGFVFPLEDFVSALPSGGFNL